MVGVDHNWNDGTNSEDDDIDTVRRLQMRDYRAWVVPSFDSWWSLWWPMIPVTTYWRVVPFLVVYWYNYHRLLSYDWSLVVDDPVDYSEYVAGVVLLLLWLTGMHHGR